MTTLKFFDTEGNEVNPEDWADAIVLGTVRGVIEQYKQRASENVSRMVCPVHGDKADLIFKVSGSPDQPTIDIHATSCCDEFAQSAVDVALQSWDAM